MTDRTPIRTEGRTYELLQRLGGGGFGEVWRARLVGTAGFSKVVAVKLLHTQADVPEANRREYEQRLRDEGRLLGALKHRAIVFAEDLIEIDGKPALVMELVDGTDLHALMQLGPVPPRVVAEIAAEVASALAVVHNAKDPESGREMGLVHRDIKPANIRIGPRGDVKVLDFGIAFASFDRREAKTEANLFFTQGYYPPERVRLLFEAEGELPPEQPTTDIYALGVVMAEALGGRRVKLSVESERHTLRRRELTSSMPRGLAELISQMLSDDPGDRPTAAMVEDRLVELAPTLEGPPLRRWAAEAQKRLADTEAVTGPNPLEGGAAVAPAPPPGAGNAPSAPGAPPPASPGASAASPASPAPPPLPPRPAANTATTLADLRTSPNGAEIRPKTGKSRIGLWMAGATAGLGGAALLLVVLAAAGWYLWSRPDPAASADAEVPTAAPAPAPASFHLSVVGDARTVTARGTAGVITLPADVPAGTWLIAARFADGKLWTSQLNVTAPVTLVCRTALGGCRVE